MTRVTVSRDIDASAEIIFQAVADVQNLPNTTPEVIKIEILSEETSGVGMRFRETRLMGKKEMETELEVTEYQPPDRVRMVTDTNGTVWDTVFTIQRLNSKNRLTIAMDARPHKFIPKLLNPLMKGMFRKGMEKHIDAVKSYCEAKA